MFIIILSKWIKIKLYINCVFSYIGKYYITIFIWRYSKNILNLSIRCYRIFRRIFSRSYISDSNNKKYRRCCTFEQYRNVSVWSNKVDISQYSSQITSGIFRRSFIYFIHILFHKLFLRKPELIVKFFIFENVCTVMG